MASLILGLVSCYPTRNVPTDSYLFQRNSFRMIGEKVPSHDVESYFLQKENRRILIFRPSLWMYDLGTHFKDSTLINRFLTKKLGESPILFDSTLINPTSKNILQHLYNLGYYNAEIEPVITKYGSLRSAKVRYNIYPHSPYTVNNVDFQISNRSLRTFVIADWSKSILDSGMVFSVTALESERERITNQLRNLGYYYFNKQQITFEADTSLNNYTANLKVQIKEQTYSKDNNSDSIYSIKDIQYRYRKVFIYPEVSINDHNQQMDTTIFSYDFDHQSNINYYFIHNSEMLVNPKAILQAIYIKPDRFFKQKDITQSYQSLNNLNIYKYINVSLRDLKEEKDGFGQLDCYIQLSKSAKFGITSNSEVKQSGGDVGVEQSFGMISRNTFKNGEILRLNLRGALEVQSVSNSKDPNTIFNIFNTLEAGISTSIELPRFLAPVKRNFFSRYFNPRTKFDIGYNYQDRPDYTRIILNGNFGYHWISGPTVSHNLNPIEVAAVKISPEPEFQKVIDNYEDPRIKYSYQDHLVLGMSYSYLFNERKLKPKDPYRFLYGKIELGGVPYNLISSALGEEKDSVGQNWIGNLPFTQFVRGEIDYRYYLPASNGNLINIFRINLGLGIPFGGSVALPFEKSFYIGGANSLRGWTLGTLGPGSFSSGSTTFEMTGDIRIEMNYEFRFPISGPLKGAVFTDVGNIFLLKESDAMPGGAFHIYNFYQKLGADIGYGLRYDMSFLVIRFDVSNPIYQPYKLAGNRWTMRNDGTNPSVIWVFNFAIGYPF